MYTYSVNQTTNSDIVFLNSEKSVEETILLSSDSEEDNSQSCIILSIHENNNQNQTIDLSSSEEDVEKSLMALKNPQYNSTMITEKLSNNNFPEDDESVGSSHYEDALSQPAESIKNTLTDIIDISDTSMLNSTSKVNDYSFNTSLMSTSQINFSFDKTVNNSTINRVMKGLFNNFFFFFFIV